MGSSAVDPGPGPLVAQEPADVARRPVTRRRTHVTDRIHEPISNVESLLTIEEVAERLNVGVRFVRRLVAERRIVFHKVGRYVRFARADVEALIEAGRVGSDPGARPAP